MECWICGDKGDSGEHLTKASDFNLIFPEVSQGKPVYLHNSERTNLLIRSKKSKHLKSKALICRNCNNSLTQQHDRSWERLSTYIYENWERVSKTNKVQLKKIFPGTSAESSKNIHLYFLKLFGCLLEETGHNDLASELAQCILTNEMHENVELFFFNTMSCSMVGISDLEVTYDNEHKYIARAHWIYSLGECSVKVRYLDTRSKDLERRSGWYPGRKTRTIRLHKI